jgi:lipoprotein NlpD
VLLVVALAAGCVSTSSVHIPSSRGTRASEPARGAAVHVVRRGETLYQIAFRYRLDQRDLARWNGIRNPDRISVGQRLRLAPPRGATTAAAPPPPATQRAPASSTRPVTPPRAAAPQAAPPTVAQPPPLWLWPTDGEVVTRFGSSAGIGTGIGIRGREGQPVRAAAGGRVVYAGNGLIGYGQLVIIKHSDTYLSAYGYNSRLLVTQGQDVARGTTIAYMGQGPERQPRLHFEIRRDGAPVDPLLLLQAPR